LFVFHASVEVFDLEDWLLAHSLRVQSNH